MENREILYKRYYHIGIAIGIAVDTDLGLLVPVIRDVDKKGPLGPRRRTCRSLPEGAGPEALHRGDAGRDVHEGRKTSLSVLPLLKMASRTSISCLASAGVLIGLPPLRMHLARSSMCA